MERRAFLRILLSLPPFFVSRHAGAQPTTTPSGTVIDVHCHAFNATDIPAEKFLRIVFLGHYPEQGIETVLNLKNKDVLDGLIDLFIQLVAGRAPTAAQELDILTGSKTSSASSAQIDLAHQVSINRVKEFFDDSAPQKTKAKTARGKAALATALQKAAKQAAPGKAAAPPDIAEVYFSKTDFGTYLRWFTLFTLYRHALVDQLVQTSSRQGFKPLLVCPALVDFSTWLDQDVQSSHADQIRVMGRIFARSENPPVHGYVSYDPLAEVLHRNGLGDRSPLQQVREALQEHGFIGVKLYPPMGFRPSGNKAGQSYPKAVLNRLHGRISADLEKALDDLYALCSEMGVPILAHAAESNGAGPQYEGRADPAFWIPVFRRWPSLHVCLAHFGRFSYVSAGAPHGAKPPETSWEWTLGRYIKEHPEAPVFADISYFSEILGASKEQRSAFAGQFRRFAKQFDNSLSHLVFGTDWIMLGRENAADDYLGTTHAFLRDDCQFTEAEVRRLLVGNAIRFLGLADKDKNRSRLAGFRTANGLSANSLPSS
jgi:predicted TIM-barrel fold metal-dependent hydrolase